MNGSPTRLFVPALVCFILISMTQFAPVALSQANVTGQWQTLPYTMPINPIHVALMHNGKVLVASGSGNDQFNTSFSAAVWDPQAGTITTQSVTWDMFCNGMVVLSDGRPFIFGGTLAYDPFKGLPNASTFDPNTGKFTDQQAMTYGRWYPTGITLSDGRIMVMGGLDVTGATDTHVEFYSVGGGWSAPLTAPFTPPLYPRMHLLPNGKVFVSGSPTTSRLFTPSTNTWVTNYATTNYSTTRLYGSSVLLPLTPANNYAPKVMIFGGGNPSTATTEIIDLSAAKPAWVFGPNMSNPRIEMDATLLPNGKVFTSGGSLNDEDGTTASLGADLYDPIANTMSSAGTATYARLYHSVTLLLPDATVWVAGGNPQRRTYEPHMEIYSPPYLFNADGTLATRPSITSVSSSVIGYGTTFQVNTPNAANISSVVLMRNGASTHAFDMEQRHVGLSFTAGSGSLTVTGPPNSSIVPAGYYMLFLLNNAGVPSIATMLQVSPAPNDQPPVGTITSPPSDTTVTVGQSVSYAGTGTSASGSISSYYWNFPGGVPTTSTLANPGSVTYSTPGTYVTSFTVTDNQGITDPAPPTRTITVNNGPNFSVSVSPTSQSIFQGGTANYTVTVTPNNGFTGTVTLSISGLPSGANGTFGSPTINTSGTSTLTVTTLGTTPAGGYSLGITGMSGSLTHTVNAALSIAQTGGGSSIDFSSGFSAAGMQFNGSTTLVGTQLRLTDSTTTGQAGSAFWTTPVNIQSFATDFTFQPGSSAEGFTFVMQNAAAGPAALGFSGGALGFAGVGSSVAVKFDTLNDGGSETSNNSTGLYTKGAAPKAPEIALGGGVNLHSGDTFQVHITYNGTTLTMTIADTAIPEETFTTSWTINIPNTVGANTAFVGFTGSTGNVAAVQNILAWDYDGGTTMSPAATPTISPATGTYTSAQTVSITDTTPCATIYFTLDGTQPTTGSATYSSSFQVASTTTVKAMATASGFNQSATATNTITITTPTPDFSISVSPPSQSITAGGTATYTVTITSVNGFAGSVSFGVTGLPTGGAASCNPTSVAGSGTCSMQVSTTSSSPNGTYTLTVTGTSGSLTHSATATLVVSQSTTPNVNFSTGFTATGMQFNGHTKLNGTRLQLTDTTTTSEVASAFWANAINIQSFANDFDFQLTNPNADGFTFCIQNIGATAMGSGGGGLGYASIGASVAVKFDLFSNAGEGNNSTGLYTKGASPEVPAITLGGGVNLHSGDPFHVHMTYDGTTLTMTITDSAVPTDTFTTSWTINIPQTVGANTAFVGFTAGTGGSTATQEILDWTFNSGTTTSPAATPTFSLPAGTYSGTQTVSLLDATAGASIFYTTDGTTPGTTVGGSTLQYSSPISVSSTTTINAIATASGFLTSAMASSTYTIASTADFTISVSPNSQSVAAGSSTTYTVTINALNGFAGTVSFGVSGLPTGGSSSFNPTTVAGSGSSTMQISTTASSPTGTYTLTITGTSGALSHTATTSLVVTASTAPPVNFSGGFSATGMQFNGHTLLNGTRLQLTDSVGTNEVASAFWATPVNIQTFTNDFTFQLTNPNANGFTFCIQNVGPTAIGNGGGGLGYAALGSSVAVKFNLFNNGGTTSNNSTGIYTKGAAPKTPETVLGGGVNLHSGDIFQVHMTYDGKTLTMTITDTVVTTDTFTVSFPINIPTTVGGNTAFVGFTAGTGSLTAQQEIITWTFN